MKVQSHIWGEKTPFNHILYKLATTYTILDPISGMPTIGDSVAEMNVEPSSTAVVVSEGNPTDAAISRHDLREKQSQASQLSKELLEGKRKLFDKFVQNETLNMNRLDRWLNHTREIVFALHVA